MKKTNYFLIISYLISFWCCKTNKYVAFENTVDTKTKKILYQNKKTFELPKMGVYASNEFDGARLNNFRKKNDSTVVAVINPENTPINNSAYYAFELWADEARELYITFEYPKGYKHRYNPKIKRGDTWIHIDTTHVFKKDSIVTIKLSLTNAPLTIAAQEIHSSTDVKNWYTGTAENYSSKVEKHIIGESALGRELVVLDMNKPSQKQKKLIVLLTRQHPPEVTGYFAFQHFLNTLLEDTSLANEFLDNYRVLAFPLLNPDGVDLGHWRHNANGVDTNRDWSRYRQPEIRQVVSHITEVMKEGSHQLVLGLDFHSTWYDVFYTNKERQQTTLPNFIDDWFLALEENIEGYKVNEKSSNSTKPVSKGWFLYGHGAVGITYEIGDATSKEKIKTIGTASATQMMKTLLSKTN